SGTKSLYLNKTVEVEVEFVKINESSNPKTIHLSITPRGSSEQKYAVAGKNRVGVHASFRFSDAGNDQLRTIKTGKYTGRIRGVIADIGPDPTHAGRLDAVL